MTSPSCETAESFLRDQIGTAIHLVSIEPDGPGASGRYFGDDAAGAAKWAVVENARGRNVYWTVNAVRPGCNRKPGKGDIVAARFVHADIDPPKNGSFDRDAKLLNLDLLPCPPSWIIDSGNGLQALWRLEQSAPDWQAIEDIDRGAEAALKADHCHNIDRLLRVPGTVNYPNKKKRAAGRAPVLATSLGAYGKAAYSVEDLAKVFPPIAGKKDSEKLALGAVELLTADDLDLPDSPAIRAAIETPKGENRSADGFHCACLMLHAGATPEQVAGILLNPGNPVSAHYLDQANPDRAARRVIEQAWAKVKVEFPPLAPEPEDIELPQLNAKDSDGLIFFGAPYDIEAEPDPIVDGLIPAGAVGFIYGPSWHGKSMIAALMAHCVATGTTFGDREVTQGGVLIVATEGHTGTTKRAEALLRTRGNRDAPIAFWNAMINLGAGDSGAKQILARCLAFKRRFGAMPRLVIVDTLAAGAVNVDEKESKDMGAIITLMKRLRMALGAEATVALVHHPGKDGTKGLRGSYALLANTEFTVNVDSGVISVEKNRDDEKRNDMHFTVEKVFLGIKKNGKAVSSAVAKLTDAAVVNDQFEQELRDAMAALEQAQTDAATGQYGPNPTRQQVLSTPISKGLWATILSEKRQIKWAGTRIQDSRLFRRLGQLAEVCGQRKWVREIKRGQWVRLEVGSSGQ